MNKTIIKTIACLLISGLAVAQTDYTDEEQEVYDVIIKLFDGMRAGDSSMVSSTFMPDAQMYTATYDREGNPILQKGELQKFLVAIGTPRDVILDEPVWNTEIKIDDRLAQVWTDYAFYAGKNFSHCGVDAFQLFKTTDGWKIYLITDTRRKEGCEIPESVKKSRQ